MEGLTGTQIASLRGLREQCQSGAVNEETQDCKRLLFARWLYEHGRVSEECAGEVAAASSVEP